MYRVYFEDKVICFTSVASADGLCDGLVVDARTERQRSEITPAKMLEKLENNKQICVESEDKNLPVENFLSHFREVDAAGGVVRGERGATLMIFRADRWDLPKGHVEQGEQWQQAALREVREETGLKQVEIGRLITTTHHFYRLAGEWVMKHTHWYSMTSPGDGAELTPQIEEGISSVRWVPKEELEVCVESAYASIKEVFERL